MASAPSDAGQAVGAVLQFLRAERLVKDRQVRPVSHTADQYSPLSLYSPTLTWLLRADAT